MDFIALRGTPNDISTFVHVRTHIHTHTDTHTDTHTHTRVDIKKK